MKVIAQGRQAGKTYKLVQWVTEGVETDSYPGWSRVLLTHSIEEASRVRRLYDLDYRQVFSIGEWRIAKLGTRPVDIVVDNVDILLCEITGQWPTQVAMTGSPE